MLYGVTDTSAHYKHWEKRQEKACKGSENQVAVGKEHAVTDVEFTEWNPCCERARN